MGMNLLFSLKKKPARKKVETPAMSVETQIVRRVHSNVSLMGFGTASAARSVALVAEVSGKAVYVSSELKRGGRVRKGVLLARIDPRSYYLNYKRLKKQLVALRKQIKLAHQGLSLNASYLRRNRRLLKRQAIDTGSYEQRRINFIERKLRLEQLKQTAAITKVQLATALLQLQKTRLRAPFDGRIVSTTLDRGDYIRAGQGVATLESRGAIEIPVSFPIDTLRKVTDHLGKAVNLEQLPGYLGNLPAVQVLASGAR